MENNTITAGVSTTNTKELSIEDLAPNNYITIVWKDVKTDAVLKLDIDEELAQQNIDMLTNTIETAVSSGKVSYAGQNKYVNIEAIGKYLAQNTIPAGTKRTVVNALITVASGDAKKLPDKVVNLCLNTFGTIADKTARSLGWTDPHNIFSQVAGQNVINVFSKLGSNVSNFFKNTLSQMYKQQTTNTTTQGGNKINPTTYTGLLLGLTTSDTESYEITIPRKKVEDGSNYTTHLLPQPFKKDFNVVLTNKVLTSDFNRLAEINAIEYTKDKLIEIANSHTLFDIYIRLSDEKVYKRSNVFFSSLSFTKDENSGDTYTASFTIEPVNSFKSKIFVSNKKYKTKSSSGTKGSGSKSSKTSSRPQKDKASDGTSLQAGFAWKPDINKFKTLSDMAQYAKTNKLFILKQEKGTPKYIFIDSNDVFRQMNGTYIRKSDMNRSDITAQYGVVTSKKNKYTILDPSRPLHLPF